MSRNSELSRDIDTYEVNRSTLGVTTYKCTKRVGCVWSVLYRIAELVYSTINMQYLISVIYGLYLGYLLHIRYTIRFIRIFGLIGILIRQAESVYIEMFNKIVI